MISCATRSPAEPHGRGSGPGSTFLLQSRVSPRRIQRGLRSRSRQTFHFATDSARFSANNGLTLALVCPVDVVVVVVADYPGRKTMICNNFLISLKSDESRSITRSVVAGSNADKLVPAIGFGLARD